MFKANRRTKKKKIVVASQLVYDPKLDSYRLRVTREELEAGTPT